MQIQKDNIREKILDIAREEFMQCGYQKFSLRSVSSKAGISTSNIYNYFKGKNEIFLEILNPTLSVIEFVLNHIEESDYFRHHSYFSYQVNNELLTNLIEFVDINRSSLDLILFKSTGSTLENYKNDMVDRYARITLNQIKEEAKKQENINAEVSEFFVFTICSFYLNLIDGIIKSNQTKDQMKLYAEEMLDFFFNGWKAVLKF